jgi:hypothetical protein
MLSSQICSVAGDLRYGARSALPDQSVALHGYSVELPESLILGSLQPRYFVSPIPDVWSKFFGISQDSVDSMVAHEPL